MTRLVVQAIRSTGFAGVERYVADVANALSQRRWDVVVLGGDPGRMRSALASRVTFVPARSTLQAATALTRQRGVTLVHAHMTAAETAAVLTRPLTSAPVVSTRHFAQPRGSSRTARIGGLLLAQALSKEVAISQFVAGAVGGAPLVLLNGVRPEPMARQARQILVMQRLEIEKDTATGVRAFAMSGLARDGWRLRIAGQGQQEDSLRRLVDTLGIRSSTDLLGFVDDPAALRAQGGLFLATAPAEPFGLSVVEAMSAGLPVVAADGGAHRETLGEAGLLFTPFDAEAAAGALRALADDVPRQRALGAAAQARQRSHLSLDSHVDRLEQVYRSVAPEDEVSNASRTPSP